jgi:Trk-type K+ transport system membrane component
MNSDVFFSIGIIVSAVAIGIGYIVFYRIVDEVNAKSPADSRINPWWANMRFGVALSSHRNLFPQSKKRFLLWFAPAGFCALTVLFLTHH